MLMVSIIFPIVKQKNAGWRPLNNYFHAPSVSFMTTVFDVTISNISLTEI